MYFFKRSHKIYLDLRGDFILSHNDELVKTQVKGAAPRFVQNALYVVNVKKLTFWQKVKLFFKVWVFVFGPSQALTEEVLDKEDML